MPASLSPFYCLPASEPEDRLSCTNPAATLDFLGLFVVVRFSRTRMALPP